ncbi:MAG: glycosyltransferase [Clostridiales bacterium]|nr:glycosyltransferase [Clostridiales bacterium]
MEEDLIVKKLSIIVPIYNTERFLCDCIDSCLCQDFEEDEFEILCINDGSPDNSEKLLREKYSDKKCVKIINKENGGVSSARNVGIKLSEGKYLAFIDSDDYYEPHFLKKAIDILEKENASSLQFEYNVVKESSRFELGEQYHTWDNMEYSSGHIRSNNIVWTCIYKAELIKNSAIMFDEKMKYAEDTYFEYLFFCEAYKANKKRIVMDCAVYNYRQVSTSATNIKNKDSKIKHLRDMMILTEHYREDINRYDNSYLKEHTICRYCLSMQAYLWDLSMNANYSEIKKEIKNLKERGLYPYPIKFFSRKTKSTKRMLINYLTFLYPIKIYYLLWCRMIGILRKLQNKRSK